MVRRQHAQRRVFEMILPDGDQLWDPELRRIDEVLEDEGLIDTIQEALSRRWPKSRLRGRPGTPAAVVLRLLVLKHLYDWSFAECVREVRGSLIYRTFCCIDCEPVPDDKTLVRLAQALGPKVWKQILGRLVEVAQQRHVVRGRKLRVDTTVVETNIHHPTDSSLLGDGVRVITRTLYKIRRLVGPLRFRDRTRSVGRRLLEIAQQSRQPGEDAQAKVKKLYRQLMGTTRAVVREAQKAVAQAKRRAKKLAPRARQRVQGLGQQVKHMRELTQRVLEQTKARVLKGNTHHPHKVLSVFETHTEAIRKGKKVKPTEFGKLVKVQEAENQMVTDYEVCAEQVADGQLWDSSLERHQRSSEARRTWPPPMPPSVRRPTNKQPRHAGCAAWRCRGGDACRQPAGRIKRNAGSDGRCAGARDAKGASVPSNDATDSPAVAIAARKEWNVG